MGGVREREVGLLGREKELKFICLIELLSDADDGLAIGQSPSLYLFLSHAVPKITSDKL
jgi:hypothetical protein